MLSRNLIRKLIRGHWVAVVLVTLVSAGLAAPVNAQPVAEKLGPEFQVNTFTSLDQQRASVAMDSVGNFVIVWDSDAQDGSQTGIFGQRFDVTGAFAGGEFLVNTFTSSYQRWPVVAMDAAGSFVVVWESYGQDTLTTDGVFLQRFDPSGTRLGGEVQVNTYDAFNQGLPVVDMNDAGRFVVAWRSYEQDGDGPGIFAQVFDESGSKYGSEFQVNTWITSSQFMPSVGVDASGDFVVVWSSVLQVASRDVFGQRFDATGAPVGAEFQVNTYTPGQQDRPAIAVDRFGNFVVAWEDGPQDAIPAQRFNASATKLGGEFLINDGGFSSSRPAAAVDPAGHFVVAWDASDGVFARGFDNSGVGLGAELLVNSFTGTVFDAAVASDAAGNFVVAWESRDDQDGSGYGVFAQRFLAPCREELALTANQWYLIGLPCEPQAGRNTVLDVFGDDLNPSLYGFSWVVFERDETTDQYVKLALTDTLTMGVGYWLQTSDSGRTIDVEGHNADFTCDPNSNLTPAGGCVEPPALTGAAGDCQDATLSDGRFNMMGHPFHLSVRWAGAFFDDDGAEVITVQAEDLQLASDQVWTWNGAAYQTGDSCTPGMEFFLSKWDGFWIDVCDDDATPLGLRIPARSGNAACSGAPPPPPGAPEEELHFDAAARDLAAGDLATGESMGPGGEPGPGGGGGGKGWKDTWYLRLVASADGLSDPGNVLGELTDSVYGYDSHDLVELQPFGTNWLTIVFPHLDWGDDSSEWYTSDYHGLRDPREWRFEVRSSEARTVTLTWAFTGDAKLVEKLERHMELVDLVTGESVPAAAGSYSFTMSGSEHPFAWLGRRGGGGPPPR